MHMEVRDAAEAPYHATVREGLADDDDDAADDGAEGLPEAVDGASDALHDALLDGHVREERGEARHGEAVADGDERERGREQGERR